MFRPIAVVMIASAFSLSAVAAEPTKAEAALADVWESWKAAEHEYEKAYEAVQTEADLKALKAKQPDKTAFADRFLKVADAHPNTDAELAALVWASLNSPASDAGKTATERLLKGRIEKVEKLAALSTSVDSARGVSSTGFAPERALAPAVLARVKALPDDPDAARMLAWVCLAHRGEVTDKSPAAFTAAADLIADKYADSPYISHFCEGLFLFGTPPFAGQFERHLKEIVKRNKTPKVIETARFALAAAVLAGGEKRQDEAEKLFRQFVTDFEGQEDVSGLLGYLMAEAKRQGDRIKSCGIGKTAQKTAGDDLDGKPVALADHKGKVVLLVFWASWCGPCMKDVPHEKELAEKFKDRPFVILGVNGDRDREQGAKAVKAAGIPWRSIWGGDKVPGGPHAEAWCVGGWPTVYVIDHAGVIRHNTLRGEKLDEPLGELVTAAEKAAKK